jgi:hypothetical protein
MGKTYKDIKKHESNRNRKSEQDTDERAYYNKETPAKGEPKVKRLRFIEMSRRASAEPQEVLPEQ